MNYPRPNIERPENYKVDMDEAITLENLPAWRYMANGWSSAPIAGNIIHKLLDDIETNLKKKSE